MSWALLPPALVLLVGLLGGRAWRAARGLAGRMRPAWRDAVCCAALVAVTCAAYLPLCRGTPPLTADNNAHLLKIVELEHLLGTGRLFGWSDRELAGYPYGLQYPVLGYLVTVAVRHVAGVSLETAYAWTMLLVVLGTVLSVYVAARLHFSRPTAVLAGLFALLDPGDKIVGGWLWCVLSGVWPASVASGLFLVALALLPRALATGRPRSLAVVGSVVGVALLFHPVVIVLAAYALLPMAVALVAAERASSPTALLARTGVVVWAALAVSAFWLIPMLAARPYTIDFVYAPQSADSLWSAVVAGTALAQPPLWFGVGVCGLLMLGRRDDVFSRFIVLFVPFALILSTAEGLSRVGLYEGARRIVADFLQVKRVYLIVRPLCFIAAGYALASLLGAIAAQPQRRGWRARLPALCLAALAALAVVLPGAEVPAWPHGAVRSEFSQTDAAILDSILEQLQPQIGDDERLALELEGRHALLAPAVLRGFKVLKLGFTPATLFKNRPAEDVDALGRLGARVLVSYGTVTPQLAGAELITRAGPFEVRDIPKLSRAWIEEGPGTAQVLAWEDERIRIAVDGTGPQSQLRLMLGYHAGWRERSGLAVSPIDRLGTGMTTLPARNGEIVLEYHWLPSQWIGIAVSLLGTASLLAWLWRGRGRSERRSAAVDAARATGYS